MLAVVEDQQALLVAETADQEIKCRHAGHLRFATRRDHATDHLLGIRQSRELHPDDTMRKLVAQILGHRVREACLSGTAGSCHGDDALLAEDPRELRALALPPDERCGPHWQSSERTTQRCRAL